VVNNEIIVVNDAITWWSIFQLTSLSAHNIMKILCLFLHVTFTYYVSDPSHHLGFNLSIIWWKKENCLGMQHVSPPLQLDVTPSVLLLLQWRDIPIGPWPASKYSCAVLVSPILTFSATRSPSWCCLPILAVVFPQFFRHELFHSALFCYSDIHSHYMTGPL
jgi:hypothetical protein